MQVKMRLIVMMGSTMKTIDRDYGYETTWKKK